MQTYTLLRWNYCKVLLAMLSALSRINADEGLIARANSYFEAALYESAIPLYEEALPDAEAKFKLIQSLFFAEKYEKLISVLHDTHALSNNERLYLASAYCKLGDYAKTIALLESSSENPQAIYELAIAYFHASQLKEAEARFKSLLEIERYRDLAKLYLAKIAIKSDPEIGYQQLTALSKELNGVLKLEIHFLLGELLYNQKKYDQAAEQFEKSCFSDQFPWFYDTVYYQGICHLKLAEAEHNGNEKQINHFDLAGKSFSKLLDHSKDEKAALALGRYYLSRGHCLNDEAALEQAQTIFACTDLITSEEGKIQSILLRAESAKSYAARETLYRHLTEGQNNPSELLAQAWYLRGLNHLEEGRALKKQHSQESDQLFDRAIAAFKQAAQLLMNKQTKIVALSEKYQAIAFLEKEQIDDLKQAEKILQRLEISLLLTELEDPDEIYLLHTIVLIRLSSEDPDKHDRQILQLLEEVSKKYPEGKFSHAILIAIGKYLFEKKQYEQALSLLGKLDQEPEALFWAGRAEQQLENKEKAREYFSTLFNKFSNELFAADAYFFSYHAREYLQGDRLAIKHLQAMPERYPNSPLTIQAWYLIGLNAKKERKTAEGKSLVKRNLLAAVDAFQESEALFDRLFLENAIPLEQLETFIVIRYRAALERAKTNLTIAEESQGTKRQIYLEYAEEVLNELAAALEKNSNKKIKSFPLLLEETRFWLSEVYLRTHQNDALETILQQMLEDYKKSKTTRGYFLSQVWHQLALLEIGREDYLAALEALHQAQDSGKGNILSPDQRIENWILESCCYQALGQIENSILILSKAINDEAISHLRIKAMYLRAEAYELQGRPELARRQLEATAKKGGLWANKAKEKLVKHYGM